MNIDCSLQNLGSYLILFHFSNNLCASAPLREKESSISSFLFCSSLPDVSRLGNVHFRKQH